MKIALIYDVNIYLSIKLVTIEKLVRYFTKVLTTINKKTVNLLLKLVRFGMS